jgi:uncharacterized membrane protein YhaH (DUF805 family)
MFQLLFNKFFTTKGRGSRKEYVIKFLLILFFGITWDYTKKIYGEDDTIFSFVYVLVMCNGGTIMLIQYFPLSIRRLHDLNASGWYVLLTFAPFGQFLILWLMFKKGTEGVNRYGEPPQY